MLLREKKPPLTLSLRQNPILKPRPKLPRGQQLNLLHRLRQNHPTSLMPHPLPNLLPAHLQAVASLPPAALPSQLQALPKRFPPAPATIPRRPPTTKLLVQAAPKSVLPKMPKMAALSMLKRPLISLSPLPVVHRQHPVPLILPRPCREQRRRLLKRVPLVQPAQNQSQPAPALPGRPRPQRQASPGWDRATSS